MNIPIRTTHFLLHKFSIHQLCFCLYVVFTLNESFKRGFPGGSGVKNLPAMQETPVRFLGQEDPLEKGQATHASILGPPWRLSW